MRARRRLLQMSQETLAEKVGVKFQQIQKYEIGTNRVSASRLKMIADALDVHPALFFDEHFQENTDVAAHLEALDGGSSATVKMIQVFSGLNPKIQEQLIEIAKSFSSDPDGKNGETEQAGADDTPKD